MGCRVAGVAVRPPDQVRAGTGLVAFRPKSLHWSAEPLVKVQASVARCLRTPPSNRYSLKGFYFRCQHRLRGESNLSIVVVGNY
jgi:hypothetical protein